MPFPRDEVDESAGETTRRSPVGETSVRGCAAGGERRIAVVPGGGAKLACAGSEGEMTPAGLRGEEGRERRPGPGSDEDAIAWLIDDERV